jgi:outer membrane protein assembly factor BamB
VPGAAAFADGVVYATLGRGKMDHDAEEPAGAVWAVQAADGMRVWEFPLPAGALNSPTVTDAAVLCTCRDGYVYAIDRQTGELAWKTPLGEPAVTAIALAGEMAVVVTVGGTIVGVNAKSGKEAWRIEDLRTADEDAYSSPVIRNGRLYVAIGGRLHCLVAGE